MAEIDQPFRVSRRFALVWGCFAVAVGLLVFRRYHGAVYEKVAVTILGSLYATFSLYGPILLARQAVSSGRHGWFVLRVAVTIVVGLGLLFAAAAFFNLGGVPNDLIALATCFVFFNLDEWLRHEPRT